MRTALCLSAAVAALCWVSPALAQDVSPRALETRVEARPQIVSVTNAAEGGVPTTALDAAASSEDGEIAFTLSGANNGRLGAGGQDVVSLRLSAPIDDEADDASFLTDDGLADTVNLKLSYSRVFLDLTRMPELETMYLEKCETDARARYDARRDTAGMSAFVTAHCGLGTAVHLQSAEQLGRFLDPEQVQAVLGHADLRNQPISILNISASIGRKVFDYLNPVDFSEHRETRIPFAFSIAYGRNARADAPFWGVGYEFKRSFGAADERTLCPVATGAGAVECRTEIFAPPDRKTTHKVFALVRSTRLFGDPRTDRLAPAVELRAAYDIQNNVFGVTLPIFILLDDQGSAKGGFRLTVDKELDRSEEVEVGFGIFITKSFDFFSF